MASSISAPLPDLTLEEQTILTIDTGDPNAVITQVVIHVSQDVPELPQVFPTLSPLLAFGLEQV